MSARNERPDTYTLATERQPGADAGPPRAAWLRDTVAASIASVATVAVTLTLGLLSYAPLGEQWSPLGITAAFVSVTLGGVVFGLLASSAMPSGGPSSATALIFASLLAHLASDPQVTISNAHDVATVISLAASSVILMGAVQLASGLLGFGALAKFVPQPVLAGFMNGVALLIVVSQLPSLLGVSSLRPAASLLERVQPFTLALGLATAALTLTTAYRWPRLPAPLIGLAGGVGLHALVTAVQPHVPLGVVIGPLPHTLPAADLAQRLARPEVSAFAFRHAGDIVSTAIVLALVGSLESILSALAIDQQVDSRHRAGRELVALGAANMVSGFFGGLPLSLVRSRALATLRGGGRGPRAAVAGALCFALLYALGGPLLAALPKAVLAGIMLTIAVTLIDRWTHQLVSQISAGERSADAKQSLLLVAVVCVVTVWRGFATGVAVGVLASLLMFIRSMNRSLVRARFTAAVRPSRRVYPQDEERLLADARRSIAVRELEGALFFGSTDRLAEEADAVGSECRHLVLDFKRVSTIDESGAVLLQQLSRRLRRRGVSLLLASVTAENVHGLRLRAFGCFRDNPRDDWFEDADHAIEAAERSLLAKTGGPPRDVHVRLEACTLFRELDAEEVAFVREHLQQLCLQVGQLLFRQNDPADRLYVLTRGSITIVAGEGTAATRQRFVSFSPGVMLGETAMLDRGGRSASATADNDVEVYVLTQERLDSIVRARPDIGVRLYRNIAVHLSGRLRSATSLQSG
jgi:SulP family sulfate permease